ncbi:hypothetical protein KSP40_PGU016591 [Platanthera guangdongensis]|uniref:Uncharacterized protein n=1 Tax=Platanthera guangdongensis TaxID=2320717 RepID=A0ABR2LHN1_9ASPA
MSMASRCSFMAVAIPAKLNDSAAKFRVSTLRNHHAEAEISASKWKKLTLHNKTKNRNWKAKEGNVEKVRTVKEKVDDVKLIY